MKDLLMDLEAYLTSVSLSGRPPIFKDNMLDSPDTAIALYEYQGNAPLPQIAGTLRSVQVVTRAKVPFQAKQLANEVYKHLQTEEGILNLTEERWCVLTLRQPPFKLKVDNSGRTYYCFNLGITTYND